jgi:hypothetical protein
MELKEEIDMEVGRESLTYLGTVENIFHFNWMTGHEIVFVYDAILKDPAVYEQVLVRGKEANGEDISAAWKSLADFEDGQSILYPAGLLRLLR